MSKTTSKAPRQAKRRGVAAPQTAPVGQEARDAQNTPKARAADRNEKRKARVREITAPLFRMTFYLAHYAHLLDEKYLLDTARILEGVQKCLAEPQERDRLAKAATVLIGSASQLPRKPGEFKTVADALVDSVRKVFTYYAKRCPGEAPTNECLAEQVDMCCARNLYRGAEKVLPLRGSGNPKERQALYAAAIRRLRNNIPGGKPDPEDVISACARALGNKREIFGAIRKSVKYNGLE